MKNHFNILTLLTILMFLFMVSYFFFKPEIICEPNIYSYGIVDRKKDNIGTIEIKNIGYLPLKINSVFGCCNLKTSEITNKTLKRNESFKVTFVYNSLEVSKGEFNKFVTIRSNDLFNKEKVVNVNGKVIGEPIFR